MKFFLLLIVSLWALPFAEAQINLVSTTSRSISANIDLAAGLLSNIHATKGDPSPIQNMDISLNYGELLLDFKLAPIEGKGYFELNTIRVLLNGQPLDLLPEQLIGETGRMMTGGEKRLIIAQLLDRFVQVKDSLVITLTIDQYAEVIDCSGERPSFSSKQHLPYYLAAGTGAACIGLGQLFKSRSQNIYTNDYLTSTSKEMADPLYQKANANHHAYYILTYGGTALLAADAILYLLRQRSFKNRLKEYEKYCGNKTGLHIEPVFEVPSLNHSKGQAGVRVTLNF
ncbi:MAG: hypothetical protein H6563_13610 [Lewinellaceae bacterium]|nr:hypothetical protein [Lewinellaceae bacterium]